MKSLLLDSNIIIYSVNLNYQPLRQYLAGFELNISKISMVEVLGYHLLTTEDKADLEDFFNSSCLLNIDDPVLQQAIFLKQNRKLSLGDSIIAATSLVHQIPLLTCNTDDFQNIENLNVINPFDFI